MSRDVIFCESIFPYKGEIERNVNDKVVLLKVIPEEELFEIHDEEFLPSQDYSDNVDLINENEEFYDPNQDNHNEEDDHHVQ